jgi:DNA polymerase-1
LIFQVFHAIPEMSSPEGMPTNALFGFTRDIFYLRTEKKPDYLLCVFDKPGPTFRDKIFTEYKAHRSPTPDDLQTQIPLIRQMLEAMHIPVLEEDGYEADDVIATVATTAAERGLEVFVCTNDKDCRQLINNSVHLFNLRKRAVLDSQGLMQEWGIAPHQVIDLQVLVGDSVDNIPGVPGIGLKTAAKLLQEFGTLDQILTNIDKIPGEKRRENLRTAGQNVAITRQLVRLATDVPMSMGWEGWRLRDWDGPRLLKLFQEWGFRTLADQVRAQLNSEPLKQRDLFAMGSGGRNGRPHGDTVTGADRPAEQAAIDRDSRRRATTCHVVATAKEFESFHAKLSSVKRFAIDVATTTENPAQPKLVGICFSWKAGEAWYLPLRRDTGNGGLNLADALTKLAPYLANAQLGKVNQNIKRALLSLRRSGIELAGVAGDSMLADYLLHAGERSHAMADLANRYLNHRVVSLTDLTGKKAANEVRLHELSVDQIAEYFGEYADLAWRLTELLESELRAADLYRLYQDVEVPLIEVLGDLEYNGIRLDVPLLRRLGQELTEQLSALEAEIHELCGRPFNIASPRQLRQILFDELGLPPHRRTGITGEASTDQRTLEALAALGHPLPKKVLEHRQIAKLKGTYVDALPDLINPDTGRIHAAFNQTIAATGRLSSSDPNLQNIPIRTEQGRQIRQAFVPAEGWLLLTADYSQIELRLLAHFCSDSELCTAFAEDRDIHASVAAQIFGVSADEVTPDMRRMAKTVNFGVLYGMSAHGLAQRLAIPRDEAARFIDAYFARYPKVQAYQQRLLNQCRNDRYVTTILGRRREISGIRPRSTYQQRNQPEREAINMQIQGSAADLIKMAMLNIYRRLRREDRRSRMLLQIHDELVFEVPPEETDEVAAMVREEMTAALEKSLGLTVPLRVDLALGPNWLDVEELADCGVPSAR